MTQDESLHMYGAVWGQYGDTLGLTEKGIDNVHMERPVLMFRPAHVPSKWSKSYLHSTPFRCGNNRAVDWTNERRMQCSV